MQEAVRDAKSGRFAIALAKHIWFHHNALRCDIGLVGVRLSFALGYWRQLADRFPRAMEELVLLRDNAVAAFLKAGCDRDGFHDLECLNRVLGDFHKTAEIFVVVHEQDRESAARLYDIAQASLVEAGEYDICGHYLQPIEQLEHAIQLFDLQGSPMFAGSKRQRSVVVGQFFMEVATLVALLAKNGRRDEAQQVSLLAGDHVKDQAFAESLGSALAGNLPTSWSS